MDHRDHVRLLRDGVLGSGRVWADLGSGEGAFTLALADLLGPTGAIHSVDRDGRALAVQARALADAFPDVTVSPMVADFTRSLALRALDGIVMANSLHFVRDKLAVLGLVRGYLRPGGRARLILQTERHSVSRVTRFRSSSGYLRAREHAYQPARHVAAGPRRGA